MDSWILFTGKIHNPRSFRHPFWSFVWETLLDDRGKCDGVFFFVFVFVFFLCLWKLRISMKSTSKSVISKICGFHWIPKRKTTCQGRSPPIFHFVYVALLFQEREWEKWLRVHCIYLCYMIVYSSLSHHLQCMTRHLKCTPSPLWIWITRVKSKHEVKIH